jgi:hypothetical protein
MNNDAVALQDAAGNDAESFYIDADKVVNLNPPSAPGTPDLVAIDDSGKSDSDNITNVKGMLVSIVIPQGISVGDSLVIARSEDDQELTKVELTALQVASGRVILQLPDFDTTSIAGIGMPIGIKARIEAPNASVDGANASNVSAWSGVLNILLDVLPPNAPTWVGVDGRSISTIGNLTSFFSKTSSPQLEGQGEAGSTIKVVANNVLLGYTTVLANGTWTFDTNGAKLSDGSYLVEITATDIAGNISQASEPLNLTIDTKVPEPPKIMSVRDDTGRDAADGFTKTRVITLNGRAEPYASIRVYLEGTVASIGNATANKNGEWVFDYVDGGAPVSLIDGSYTFTAVSLDVVGNESKLSGPFVVKIDNVAPATPVISGFTPDTGISSSDQLTKTNAIELFGTSESNALVVIYKTVTNVTTQIASAISDING